MSYIFRITALDNKWGGAINKGESFTLISNGSYPNDVDLKKMLENLGRTVNQSTSLPFIAEKENFKISNNWLVERLGKN